MRVLTKSPTHNGLLLQDFLREEGMTQATLAYWMKLHPAHVSNSVYGRNWKEDVFFMRLCQMFDLEPGQFEWKWKPRKGFSEWLKARQKKEEDK